ncbi:MAG: hypothetical protein FRX49_01023 [Trebouxia sp. A1-2]|nr:MAG: hypothetical protein FRX49_01023 [Trebouxia sp. A1-2]
MEAVLAEKAYEALQAERQSTEFRIKALGKALEYKHLEAAHGSHVEFLKIPITLPQAQAAAPGTESDVHQLKMELAGYQSCCKRLGDDLAVKDQELEDWRRQTEDQKKRTEQVILDTSAREAELLLRNRELTQELEKQRQEAGELTCTALTKEESLGKLQVEVHRLSSSVSALRNNDPDPEQQLASMRTDMAEKDQKINSLEKYIAGIMKDGITNNVVLKELHEALAAKDSSIAELQRYIDLELKTESASEVEQEAASAVPDGITDGFRFASERSAKPGNGDESSSEADSAEPEILSFGQTTLKISQLKAQIHRLESRLDSSSSEASSDDGEVRPDEADVQQSWWSAKADSLTAEVVRLQTEAAEAEERHSGALQGAHDTIETLQTQVLDLEIKVSQAKVTLSDSQHGSAQDVAKLQEQLRLSELKATLKSDSDSSLRALTAEIAQLRGELQAKVKDAAAAAAASQEAVSAAKVVNLQERLQQAEAQATTNAEAHSKLALTSRELTAAQSRVSQYESSLAEAEEEHKAAMQGADDHINRLQAQVQSLQANSAQAELNRVKAELGESENAVSHLRQQLEAQQAEVLRLKESQGGSNKAADVIHALEKQVHELRANLTAAAAATARAQQQADTAHADMAKLQTQLHSRTNSPAVEAELQELRSQLRSAQNLAAQQQQEAMLSRGGSWGYDGADLGIDHGGSTPRLLSPRPSFSARQGPGSSRRGSGGSPLNPRLSMSGMQANDTINMLEAEVNELQAELAATQAVAAKHQRTAAASGQEIKVLQRLSSSGDISFMRTHSQTGRRSTTGHRHSEQGIPSFGSHDDLIHLQARCEASEAEVQHLQQRLHAASSDRTAELEHVQQLNRSLKAEIAAMQNNLAGMSGTFTRPDSQTQPEEMNSHGGALESFGSCLLIDPGSSLGQSLPQLGGGNDASDNNMLQPYRAAHRLASIPEGDGNVSTHTSMQGDEGMQDVHLVPELQSQVRSLAVSLQDKTQEAEALHQIVDQFKSEASGSGSPSSSSERPLRLRLLMKSFSTGSRGYERMHNVKNNVKQLLMPWKRKLAEFDGEEVQNNDDFGTHPVLQTLQGIARTKPGQQTVTELDMAWHHDQLEDAHEMCDKLEQQNDFLRAELAKHGVIVEGDEERSFALGCVPDQPRHSSSFSDSVPGSARGADGKGGASEMGDSISGVRPALLNIARESDAACHELQQMMDRLQGQLSATTSTAPPNISPFAKVAAGSKEEQLQATKSLCSEAVLQAVEVRSHLAALVEVLQPREAAAEEGNVEPITEEPNKASPPPTAAWRQSFDVSGSSNFGDPANRDSLDSSVGTRPSFDLQPKTKQTVSFQMLDQPVYSANLDSFVSGNRKLEHDLSSFDSDFDTSQLDNPLFGSTMGREHVHGTRGVALTRASVAAQMFQNMAQADSSLNVESRQQLAQGVRVVKHQVTDKSKQLDAASAQLAQTLAQMHALVVSTSALTDQLTSTQQQFRAEQATSHRLSQQLDSSQSECMRLKAQAQDSRQGLQDAVDKTKHWRRSTEEHQALLEQSAGHSSQLQADLEHVIEVTGQLRQQLDSSTARCAVLDAELAGARLAVSAQQKKFEVAQSDRQALARKVTELAHCEVDLSIAQTELTQLRSETDSLRQGAAEQARLERQLAQKEAEVTRLQAELQAVRQELGARKSLSRQLVQTESDRANLQADVSRIMSELTAVQSSSHDMQSRHAQQAAELSQLRSELSQNRHEVTRLRAELSGAQSEVSHRDSEVTRLQTELESMRQQALQWPAQSSMQARLIQQEAELSQLQAEKTNLQNELSSSRQQLQVLTAQASASGESAQSRLQPEPNMQKQAAEEASVSASVHVEAAQEASVPASPSPLAETASVSSGVSHQESEAMSEGELKKMAEAFRKSLGLESSSSTVRLPRTKSALFKVTSNKAQESQLFSEIGLLEADLTSTRKDLYAANVRTKSLTSVLKDRTGKMQALEDRVASHDELFKAANQKAARLQNSLQVLQSKLQERDDQVSAFEIQTQQLHTILNKRANDSRAAGQATNEVVAQLAQRESQLEVAEQQRVRFEREISALHAELSQQHAEVQSLQAQLEVVNEREMASSLAADLDHLLDDPDQLPAEAHQLMSSLQRDPAQSDQDLPAKLQQLQKQLHRMEEDMRDRDAAMQQLLRGADRIEDVQRDTFRQLADAQSECASKEVQLTSSAQEISQLRAQLSMVESKLAAHDSRPGTPDSSSPAAHMAELVSLRAELQQKELEVSELHLQLQAALSTSAEGLSRGVSGQSPDSEQVEQLQSELQQRGGQVQKLKADLEYSQDELQDLQRHCRSLEVEVNKLRDALVSCEPSKDKAASPVRTPAGRGRPAPTASASSSAKGSAGATVALRLLKERADSAEARAAAALRQVAELKASLQVKLDSQKRKRQQLEEEVSASQAHVAELTAILKSAVRSNSGSGPTGSQSPRSSPLSREVSGGEVGPRLRSKELQALTQRLQMSVADARSDLERHSSLKSADLRAEFSGSSRKPGQIPLSPDRAPTSPRGRPQVTPQAPLVTTPHTGSGRSTPSSDSQRWRQVQPAKPLTGSDPKAKRPSFSTAAGVNRQVAWQ